MAGEQVIMGKRRYRLELAPDGMVRAAGGYAVDRLADADSVHWLAEDGSGHRCVWTRKQPAPKRHRAQSERQAAALRDEDELRKWFACQRRLPPPAKKPKKDRPPEPVEPEPKQPAKPPRPPVVVTEAELRRYTRALQKRERPAGKQDKQDRQCFSSKVKQAYSDDEDDRPGWLHRSRHVPAEWGGWQRLLPHAVPHQVMLQLAKGNFRVGKATKRPRSPNKLAVETLARCVPDLTARTAQQYRDSHQCAEFLSEQSAWLNVTRKQIHGHVASHRCASYVSKRPDGEIEAAAILRVKTEGGLRSLWIEFIRSDNQRPASDGPRPVPRLMAALDAKLGPVLDKLVLQVHSDNTRAARRFEHYGFVRDTEYDERWSTRGVSYQLVGMSKTPQGRALELARARRQAEARKRESEQQQPGAKGRPRRAAAREVDYREPEDPGITADDLFCVRQ